MLGAATTLGDLCHQSRARLKHLTRCSHPAGTKPPPHQQAETPTGQEHDGQQELELIHLNSRPRLAHLEPKWKENKVGYLLTSAHFLSYETAFLHQNQAHVKNRKPIRDPPCEQPNTRSNIGSPSWDPSMKEWDVPMFCLTLAESSPPPVISGKHVVRARPQGCFFTTQKWQAQVQQKWLSVGEPRESVVIATKNKKMISCTSGKHIPLRWATRRRLVHIKEFLQLLARHLHRFVRCQKRRLPRTGRPTPLPWAHRNAEHPSGWSLQSTAEEDMPGDGHPVRTRCSTDLT